MATNKLNRKALAKAKRKAKELKDTKKNTGIFSSERFQRLYFDFGDRLEFESFF